MTPTVTVVIPAKTEETIIADCLAALRDQDEPPEEVIVVDDGSRDATAEIAAALADVTMLHEPRSGIGLARSTGFDAA